MPLNSALAGIFTKNGLQAPVMVPVMAPLFWPLNVPLTAPSHVPETELVTAPPSNGMLAVTILVRRKIRLPVLVGLSLFL